MFVSELRVANRNGNKAMPTRRMMYQPGKVNYESKQNDMHVMVPLKFMIVKVYTGFLSRTSRSLTVQFTKASALAATLLIFFYNRCVRARGR